MSLTVLAVQEHILPKAPEQRWLSELPPTRRAELLRWPDAEARRQSLWGSRLLREGLRQRGFPTDSLAGLVYSASGKPSLDLPLHFCLSHCTGLILCVLSTAGPVGVDAEPLGHLNALPVRLYFSPQERAWAGDDPDRLLNLWTRKEAIVKAGGTLGLRQMHAFETSDSGTIFAGTVWHTAALEVGPAFVAQVALSTPIGPLDVIRIPAESLL